MQILWNNFLGLSEAVVSLLLLIDSVIYWAISELFGLYIDLAQAKVFKNSLYLDISNKIYLIMGVVALFIATYVLLQSIVNPDNIKKSGFDFVKKFVIAIIMIILTPAIFSFLYNVQDVILDDNVIGKVLIGNSNTTDVYATYFFDKDNPELTADEMVGKIENKEYDVNDFVLDPDGNSSSRKVIRYFVDDECQETDYASAMKNCNKVKLNGNLMKAYGNNMALSVLEAFLHPANGFTDDTVVVNAANAAGIKSGKSDSAWLGCGLGMAASVVIVAAGSAAGVITFGFTGAAGLAASAMIVGGACGVGAAAGSEIYEAANYEKYTWAMAKNEILAVDQKYSNSFNVITAFGGDGSNGNQGIVGGEMSYMPLLSMACGLVLLYMIFSFCIDLGLRAAKLAFYQMLAPISFLLNILPGQKDLVSNWIKKVLATWGEIFVRIFTMMAIVYLFSHLNTIKISSTYGLVAKAIIVMGLIAFIKEFPKLLADMTGIKSENMKFGIMNKLNAGTFGLAGGVVGGATGFLGAGIAAKAAGSSFFAGGLAGAANGWKARGNQFGKQKQSMYKSLGGKGKAGLLGRRSWVDEQIVSKMKDAPKNAVNKNVDKFESGSHYQNTLRNLYAQHYGLSVDDYNEANNLGLANINSELDSYDYESAEREYQNQTQFLDAMRKNTDYDQLAGKMFTHSDYYDSSKSLAENKVNRDKFIRDHQKEIDDFYIRNGGQHASGFANAIAKQNEQKEIIDRVNKLNAEKAYLTTSMNLSNEEKEDLSKLINGRARAVYENSNSTDPSVQKYKKDIALHKKITKEADKASANADLAKYLKDFMKDNNINKDDKKK